MSDTHGSGFSSEDDRLFRELGNTLEVVPGWLDLVGKPSGEWAARSGSELADDDEVSKPITVSSGAWHAMMASVSHLDSLRDSLFKDEGGNRVTVRISTHAQYSLIRGALENASRAIWLLEHDSRPERILRRLQQDWSEQRQLNEVSKVIGSSLDTDRRSMEDRRSDLEAIARRAGVDTPSRIRNMPGYGDIVKVGTAVVNSSSNLPFVIWKACSALAHGDLRGSLAYIDVASVGTPSPGMTLGRMSGSAKLLCRGGQTAVAMTARAFEIYLRRADRLST